VIIFESLTFLMNLKKKIRMRKPYLSYILALLALTAVAVEGCNKRVGLTTNGDELQTPYSVYFSDSAGVLYNSNNGDLIKKLVFPADGYPSRAFAITGPTQMVWVKKNAHVSLDNGNAFGPTYFFVNPGAYNQSGLLYAKDQERVYLASTQGWGVVYNEEHGDPTKWQVEQASNWDAGIVGPVSVTSYTQLNNGFIYAYDDFNNRLFVKDNKGDAWSELTIDTTSFKHHHPGVSISLASYKNVIVAIDSSKAMGAWFSTNGISWSQFSGIGAPSDSIRIACAGAPFNEELFIGTYYRGLYRLENGVMVSSNEGLDANTIVRGIKGKIERYKNDSEQRIVYITTNNGVYRSYDIGRNWTKIKEGNFINVY
jgi:hypothetical protein